MSASAFMACMKRIRNALTSNIITLYSATVKLLVKQESVHFYPEYLITSSPWH